jgi:phosphoribosylformimino-5-aminoimidazole carboxamide ribotide isomerase
MGKNMIIYPAIDILDGNCVRLYKGDYGQVTKYADDPFEMALAFKKSGATHLHIVDLDGARTGRSVNLEVIKNICSKTGLLVQTGGGVRTLERIGELIEAKADRVVLGTAAIKDTSLVEKAVAEFGKKIVVGIDALNGLVSTDGWTSDSGQDAVQTALNMKSIGVSSIIYTDISKDGTLKGANIEALKEMIEKTGLDVVASGGIKDMSDILNVKKAGAYAVITGKAIYEGKIKIEELFESML